jgi:hypothetical protein
VNTPLQELASIPRGNEPIWQTIMASTEGILLKFFDGRVVPTTTRPVGGSQPTTVYNVYVASRPVCSGRGQEFRE